MASDAILVALITGVFALIAPMALELLRARIKQRELERERKQEEKTREATEETARETIRELKAENAELRDDYRELAEAYHRLLLSTASAPEGSA